MIKITLSRSAEADLYAIDLHTIELFGFDQADATANIFREAFIKLAANPGMGRTLDDLNPTDDELRFWVVLDRFLIVYQPTGDGIRIARIIDGSRDMFRALEDDPGK
ncbi:MAG: type II toxin-antitoxin system RelE/ParE family toxin [Planctomycetota bacterium]|jgi:plasmid stabilization system protein ParE